MPLRLQLISLVAVALLLSLVLGGALVSWRAAGSVETELQAALAVSERAARNTIEHLPTTSDQKLYLEQLIAAFDGNRHVQAAVVGEDGRNILASSMPMSGRTVPGWFVRLVGVDAQTITLPLASKTGAYASVSLRTDARNEVSEVWARFTDDMLIMAAFSALTLLLVYWIVGRGLAPLQALSGGLRSVGAGSYGARVESGGPPEVRYLAHSFNRMAEQLGALEAKNRRLHGQLASIQEEERADLARDLHDEVGPFLFAVNVDAAAVARLAEATTKKTEIVQQVRSIQESVGHVQRHVRAILEQLRPAGLVEVGLGQAVNNLALFWQKRHGNTSINVDIAVDGVGFGQDLDEAVYRVIQESLSNAVRHGRARFIDVSVVATYDNAVVVEISDDGIGLGQAHGGGFGLVGMKERVEALGGTLTVVNRPGGRGVVVTAQLPGRADADMEAAAP